MKKILMLSAIIFMALCFTGCGPNEIIGDYGRVDFSDGSYTGSGSNGSSYKLKAPSYLSASNAKKTSSGYSCDLSWGSVSGAYKYEVASSTGGWSKTVYGTSTSFSSGILTSSFRVRAVNSSGDYSDWTYSRTVTYN